MFYDSTILPFSGLSFFMISFGCVGFLYFAKYVLKKYISYQNILFILMLVYFIVFLPRTTFVNTMPFFLVYMYGIYVFFANRGFLNRAIPMVLVAIPMILFKLDVHVYFKLIGISYITFRTIQAIIDSENYGKLNFIEFTLFLLFPTTLLAGPIDRSYRFQKDLHSGYKTLTYEKLLRGWEILTIGVMFKFVFADMVSKYWLTSIDTTSTTIIDMLNSAYAYTTYLYFDFSGYSAMAVGLSVMMGIDIPINFNKPFLALNPQDFWRRFHITLGQWLTDYFFKPIYKYLHEFKVLKGKRLLNQNIAIIMTFLLMGIWNGLTWYYIFSGFLFGIYSAIHNTYVVYVKKGGYDVFSSLPFFISLNLKRFLMLNAAVLALYFFSGRVPV